MEGFIQSVTKILDGITFLPNYELKLAFFGAIGMLVLFLISLLLSVGSKVRKLCKQLVASTKVVAAGGMVNEENVENVHAEMEKLPETAQRGWSCFLDQRLGYPSDYMPEKEVLKDRVYSGKNTAGKLFFSFFGLLLVCLVSFLSAFVCSADYASVGIKDFTNNFSLVGSILATAVIPILCYVAFYLLISRTYHGQTDRLTLTYRSFQDVLDSNVIIYASEEKEFSSENLGIFNAEIEEMVRGRMGETETIEILTAPKIYEAEYDEYEPEPAFVMPEPEPEPELASAPEAEPETSEEEKSAEYVEEEVAAAAVPMTREEEERYLAVLIDVVDRALSDPNCSPLVLEEIAVLIATAKEEGFEEQADQDILDECLTMMATRYFSVGA